MNTLFTGPKCLAVAWPLYLFFAACIGSAAERNTIRLPKSSVPSARPNIIQWDLNKNGRLDSSEQEAFSRDKLRERREQLEARAKAAADLRRAHRLSTRTNTVTVPSGFWRQFDNNRNGLLDPSESAAYHDALDGRRDEQKRALAKSLLQSP